MNRTPPPTGTETKRPRTSNQPKPKVPTSLKQPQSPPAQSPKQPQSPPTPTPKPPQSTPAQSPKPPQSPVPPITKPQLPVPTSSQKSKPEVPSVAKFQSAEIIPSSSFKGVSSSASKTLINAEADNKEIPRNIIASFNLFRFIMLGLARFPFALTKESNGSFSYKFSYLRPEAIIFLIVNSILTIILFLNLSNYFGLFLNYPNQTKHIKITSFEFSRPLHDEEVYILHRNNSAVVSLFAQLVHIVLSSWSLYFKRDLVVKYLTFWGNAASLMNINVAKDLKKFMIKVISCYAVINFKIIIIIVIQFIPITTGGPTIFTMLTLRCFYPAIHTDSNFRIYRSCFSALLTYIRICSLVYIVFFLFQCKLLNNAITEWNQRLKIGLFKKKAKITEILPTSSHTSSITIDADKINCRTGYEELYKDYHCIVNLIEGTDQVFSIILETFYGAQVLEICFQSFHFFSAIFNEEEFVFIRRLDVFALGLYLLQSCSILFLVSISAASVSTEMSNCVDVIRRKGLLGKKSDQEAYFMLSMSITYSGYFPTALTGGKFFVLDKPFLIAIGGVIFTYTFLIIQFTYIFKGSFIDDINKLRFTNNNIIIKQLLEHVEEIHNIFNITPEFA